MTRTAVREARWDTAMMNGLPDSCFALIRAGGTKDAEGKTTPRSLRMFPYKNADGQVDLPHLRNALARLPQAQISDAERARARARLVAAAKAAGIGDYAEGRQPRDAQGLHRVIESDFPIGSALQGARVDREAGVIRDVTLLGAESQNGYSYTRKAMEEAAHLYEGVRFYVDHPGASELRDRRGLRRFEDLAGRVKSPRLVGDRVRGDLHLLKGDPLTERIFRMAEQMPELVGNSHRADVVMRRERVNGADRLVVEGVRRVLAMELVTEPATVTNLFEGTNDEGTDMKDLTLDTLRAERPDLVDAILQEGAAADDVERLQTENKALKQKVDAFEAKDRLETRRQAVANKLEEARLPKELVTDVFREQLVEAKDDAAIAKLIEDRKALAGVVRATGPRSSERSFESKPAKATADGTVELDEAAQASWAQKIMGRQLSTVAEGA